MSDLTNKEKKKLERAFGMASGFVLYFSNRTFEEFILDSVGIEIYSDKYDYGSGSKANRMRALWDLEPNHVVSKVLGDILDEWEELNQETYNPQTGQYEIPRFPDDCVKIVERLKTHSTVPEIETLKPNTEDKDFEALSRSVKEYIKRNEPETGIDRLHTFVYRYIRNLCTNYGISIEKSKPLHSAFGEYVKSLLANGVIETEMTARILKTNISILEAFNKVRNEHSQAHDNEIISYQEALLIFNNVVSMIGYLESIEKEIKNQRKKEAEIEVPF